MDVAAFGAHPDDVELAVGGSVRRLVEQGYRVALVDLTPGQLATRGTPRQREQEAEKAAEILGVAGRSNAGLQDGDLLPTREGREAVIRQIRALRPKVVLAPAQEDLHPDHRWAGVLVKEAAFLAGLARWDTGQEPYRPRVVLHYFLHTQHRPDLVVDVTTTFEIKRRACQAYRSQFHDPDSRERATYISSEGFWDWWEGRARHYGNLIGATFGEPFLHDGPLPVGDMVSQFRSFGYYPPASGDEDGSPAGN